MDEEIQKKLNELITADQNAQDNAEARAKEKREAEQQSLETWRLLAEKTIVPALEEFAALLTKAGWVCHTNFDTPSDITLTVYKGDMQGVGGSHTRPRITFSFDAGPGRMRTHHSTPSQGGQGEDCATKDADAKWVQQQALGFFGMLAKR